MKPLISLIIPCYNVQNYVQAALQSVADSLSPEHRGQVEWLIVDDGATDQTPDIIARFAAQVLQPQQIPHRIIRQSNAGLSAARNTGLAHAQGEYVLFLDSDDIFVQAALDKILAVLAHQQPDIIEFDAQMFVQPSDLSPQNPTLYGQYFRDTAGKDHQSSLQRAFEENRWYVWSRCYRRSLLERHPFIVGKLFEDMMFTPYVYLDAHTVYRLPEVLLGYRQNAGSITANVNMRHINDLYFALETAFQQAAALPQHAPCLAILQRKTWRLIVAYCVKLFLKTRDVQYLRQVRQFRAQTRARFGCDLGWQWGYFAGSLLKRLPKKFGL